MKPEDFVRAIRVDIVEENADLYGDMLRTTDRSSVKDEYWKTALSLYDSLDDEGKAALLTVMRQVAVDTASNVLGVLDGSSSSSIGREDFALLDSTGNKLSGSLQDLFLESEESQSTL